MYEMIQALKNNDGLTLKNGKIISYKTGWQIATEGIKTVSPILAYSAVKKYGGNCGIWYSNGVYYVDRSKRVKTKKAALEIGRAHSQISIFGWAKKNLVYC